MLGIGIFVSNFKFGGKEIHGGWRRSQDKVWSHVYIKSRNAT